MNTKNKKYYLIGAMIIIALIVNFISYNIINKKVENELYEKVKIVSNKKITQFCINILHQQDTLNSIVENKTFIDYVATNNNIKYVEELFLSSSKSHKYIFQIRYLDNNGQEIIRVDKDHQNRSHLITKKDLQNKKSRYYFNDILNQKRDQIWYSRIDLNMEHDKIEKPIKPTVRIGLPIFHKNERKGILIFNIAVKNIFRSLRKDNIFNVFIIDKDGEYLYHKNKKYSWSKYLNKNQNIINNIDGFKSEFLKEEIKYFNGYYLQKLYIDNSEGLMIVLKAKDKIIKSKFNNYYSVVLSYIVFILIVILLILYIFFSFSDHKLKEKLLSSEKMASMGEMIGNIAHQWRQPLSVISTASTGMKLQKEFGALSDEQFNKNCDVINNQAQYLSKTIDDFRNFIKGSRTKKVFDLKDDIESFLHLVEGSIKSHNINMILDLENNINIDGYENELTQCFINIFNNAKDVLKEKVTNNRMIFISTSTKKDKVIIKIKDNAGDIPEDILPKIFEPYFTTKHQAQGTGLGLHMTYNLIVDGMNGTIEANNVTYTYEDKEYKGAEFIITLPI